ncbi:hypothetical protein AX15_000034 [Amanita polypyramis BW_CC]|nr:hypothetical protein AX15_000034 [Amanita polypyramis BW_CC]
MEKSALKDVQKLLKSLHDTPIDNAGASDEVLGKVYAYLMNIPPSTEDRKLHWFCDKADATTVAAASFLLRLFAYDSPQVDAWKTRLHSCLRGCCGCVWSMERIKVDSRHTYFGAFPDGTLESFYKSFETWELASVQREIVNASAIGSQTNVHPATVYRALFNWTIFSATTIQSVLQNGLYHVDDWPKDLVPPGTLLFLFHRNPEIRKWAQGLASKATVLPIPDDQFVGMYKVVLNFVVDMMSPDTSSAQNRYPALALSTDKYELWRAFRILLRNVPPGLLKSKKDSMDVYHVVVGHLHDDGPEFTEIFECLLLLLNRLGVHFWGNEGVEYPQVVFDAVKDNPAFATLLEQVEKATDRSRYLAWFVEYLHTILKLPVFGEVLAKMVDFLCEEMQHERFDISRPFTVDSTMNLLNGVLRKRQDADVSVVDAALRVIDIHTETIVSVAFSRAYNDEKWRDARRSARTLVSNALARDIEQVCTIMTALCAVLAEVANKLTVRTKIPDFSIRKQMWDRIYPVMQTNDIEGLVTIISIVARSAHIDKISKTPFRPTFSITDAVKGYVTPEVAIDTINNAIDTFSEGFLAAMTRFGDYNVSTSGLHALQQPGAAKDVMLLLVSPVEQIQAAAKSLTSLAFDVDGRQECFRALLENVSDAAFEGVVDFLTVYIQFAPVVPEACSLSGSLVRCFTDIIEALCASPSGLLRESSFLRPDDDRGPAAQLPQLWTLMTKSLSIIFKRCPSWSVYFENEEMVLWMRDALIFGRDMLAQWRVIDKAASARHTLLGPTRPNRLSPVGKKMVNSLQEVLPELARWLRLTDEELLHQSFTLIQTLLDVFRDTGIPPPAEGLAKLNKHLERAKSDKTKTVTRLDSSRLSALADAIASFDENDDIEIVSVSLAPNKGVKKEGFRREGPKAEPIKTNKIQPRTVHAPNRKSSYFTEEDQRKLDDISSMPTWKKPGATMVTGTNAGPKISTAEIKNEGKASSPPASSSESSEEESEDEGHRGGLAALSKFQKSPKIKKITERRQIKTIDITGVKNTAHELREKRDRQEEARRLALRMKPNLNGLHRALLSWNYNHNGPMPPGEKVNVSFVPDVFKEYGDYRKAFEPLLLMECWAQICQAKDERQEAYSVKIASRANIDDWVDLDVLISESVKKDWYLAETDVVLLRHPTTQKCIMAKTQSYRSGTQILGPHATLRCIAKVDGDPGLQISSTWLLSKVFSLSTIHREYGALVSLPYYDYVDMILRPQLPMPSKVDPKDVQSAMSTYGINEPQATAILSSLDSFGFSLIQGPPGTGKTSTICGLVAIFLSRRGRPATSVQVGKSFNSIDKNSPSKILICAPSNAAIDEVAYRIKEGYRGSKQRPDNAKVVRIGTEKAINISVRDISLDTLVDQKLNGIISTTKEKGLGDEVAELRAKLNDIRLKRSNKLKELTNLQDNVARYQALEEEVKRLNSQRMAITQRLDRLKDEQKSESRTLDAIRRRTRFEVLQEADVICTTLSGSGHEILGQFEFDTIIIDEAAQAIELSSLIPLKYKCNRCVLVGDPQQLPPTVISQEASRYGYNQSLFVRLQKQRPEAMQLLSIQYRMHPEISHLPSRVFYENRLQDGPDMAAKTAQPWHSHPKFGTYKFFNVNGTEEQSSRSLINPAECQAAAALYAHLRRKFSYVNLDFRVGVVSMYRAQVVELRRRFERYLGEKLEGKVDFNTVDGFQGQEKDVIILSCVRGGLNQDTVGFLADLRRMNVALTRAKSSLFILGNAATLERSNTTWAEIVSDARSRSCFINADEAYFTTLTPSSPTSVQPITSRRVSKPVPTPVPVPSDLVTPKSLKANVERTEAQSKQPPSARSTAAMDRNTDQSNHLKRPIEDAEDSSEPPPKTSRTDGVQAPSARPRSPPPRRPRQPQTMFIPKKKRP